MACRSNSTYSHESVGLSCALLRWIFCRTYCPQGSVGAKGVPLAAGLPPPLLLQMASTPRVVRPYPLPGFSSLPLPPAREPHALSPCPLQRRPLLSVLSVCFPGAASHARVEFQVSDVVDGS